MEFTRSVVWVVPRVDAALAVAVAIGIEGKMVIGFEEIEGCGIIGVTRRLES